MNNSYVNSSRDPSTILKISILTYLCVQAIRQLVLVNNQFANKVETRAGQVSTWFTIVLTLAVAGILSQGPLNIKSSTAYGGLLLVFLGALGSGIAMIYDKINNKETAEPARMWFGIAHVILALVILTAYLILLR
jgi:putative copper export protein